MKSLFLGCNWRNSSERWHVKWLHRASLFSTWLALHHLVCANISCVGSFLSAGSCICLLLMNDWGQLSVTVFLRLCACGLCGLSHSEKPCGDIFGDGLSWVGAHTESLTDAGSKERGMFSYGEETRLNLYYGGRVSPRGKANGSDTEMHMRMFKINSIFIRSDKETHLFCHVISLECFIIRNSANVQSHMCKRKQNTLH